MKLQNIIIPERESEMYLRGGEISEGKIALAKGDTASFDTYFNAFYYTKYRDYTNAESVTFSMSFRGGVTVRMCVFDGERRVITEKSSDSGEISVFVDFSKLPPRGLLYPEIYAESDCEIYSGEYSAEARSREISAAVAICTFRREQYVMRNIEYMRNFDFSYIKKVFVIDNGRSLNPGAVSDERISVLPNKNYGGSGGFTRGLIEAYEGGYSHVILMDDDVEFNPNTLEQMTIFVSILKDRYKDSYFSAAMLPLCDTPYMQYEMGAVWNGKRNTAMKTDSDIREQKVLLDNLDNPEPNYGAWWCILMPLSVVEKVGLPFPFFIKLDDIEYGLRRSKDTEIITMNGISVLHEPFDRKASLHLEYYFVRNALVMDSVHGYGASKAASLFVHMMGKQILLYRYDNCRIILRALNDYLKGVDFFLSCDEEKLNTELMKDVQQLTKTEDVAGWSADLIDDTHAAEKMTFFEKLTFGGHLIPSWFLDKKTAFLPMSKLNAHDVFLKKEVVQYQLDGTKALVTRRSFRLFFGYCVKCALGGLKIMFRYKGLQKKYIARKNEITSMEFWKKHLGIK